MSATARFKAISLAIAAVASTAKTTMWSLFDSVVSANTAVNDGGGVYIVATMSGGSPSTFYAEESVISGNIATNGRGGGIHNNSDSVQLYRTTIDDNRAGEGGGIYHSNPNENFTYNDIVDTTISNNRAVGGTLNGQPVVGRGGGISVAGAPLQYVRNITISGNEAIGHGGGLYVGVIGGEDGVSLRHATVANNIGGDGGGGIYHDGSGDVRLDNSLVAENFKAAGVSDDLWGDFNQLSDSNLIGNGDGSTGFDPLNGNQVGTLANPIIAGIEVLADNGGLTQTHALLANSPAIDAGSTSFDEFRRPARLTPLRLPTRCCRHWCL